MSKDEFAKIIDALKEKLDETTNALVSEELLAILDTYGIKYKKNYSVSRLINLILDNCK